MPRRHVYFYTPIGRSFDEVGDVLEGDPAVWLPPPAIHADGAWRVTLHAHEVALPGQLAEHAALVEVGEPARHDIAVLRGLVWRSASAGGLVPTLEADLELVPLSDDACQLSLLGSYRPPLSVAGDIADRLLGHRIAEACVRRFVLDVADQVTATLHA